MSRKIATGIDIGTSYIKTVIAEKRDGEAGPRVLGCGISSSEGLRRGFVINPCEVSVAIKNSLKKAQDSAGITVKQAFISADGVGILGKRSKGSIIVSRTDREVTKDDIERALQQSKIQLNQNSSSYFLNKDILHNFPISYKIDNELIIGDPLGVKGEKLEVETLFITSSTQYLNNLVKSVELSGVTVEDIAAAPWAMSHALLNQKEKEVGCLIINIGGDTSSVIVFEDGSPISVESFPIGSNHITYDIAKGFQVLLDEAEQLKISSYGSDLSLKRKLNTIVESRLNDIFELTGEHLRQIRNNGILPAGVILTGGGANLNNIEEIARKSLELPSRLSQPMFSENNKGNSDMINPVWSVAFGLCCAKLEGKNGSTVMNRKILPGVRGVFSKLARTFLP
ncbi:cell division protein FtsA [Patescibacteria group bacterium]|nr:cell division protein FtsA [Patescibacteria group bacterium]MBU2632943.1 cell division protein FtsA [Patescibacteria group bacterium]